VRAEVLDSDFGRRVQIYWFLGVLVVVVVLLMLPGALVQTFAARLAAWWGLQAGGPEAVLNLDGLIHLLLFTLLAVLGFRPWWAQQRISFVLSLTALAALTECVQASVPGRSASWSDFSMDLAGIGMGLGLCLAWCRWRMWRARRYLRTLVPSVQRP
jgi:hypothetical protein